MHHYGAYIRVFIYLISQSLRLNGVTNAVVKTRLYASQVCEFDGEGH